MNKFLFGLSCFLTGSWLAGLIADDGKHVLSTDFRIGMLVISLIVSIFMYGLDD